MQVPALFLPIGSIKKISAKNTPKIVEKKIIKSKQKTISKTKKRRPYQLKKTTHTGSCIRSRSKTGNQTAKRLKSRIQTSGR